MTSLLHRLRAASKASRELDCHTYAFRKGWSFTGERRDPPTGTIYGFRVPGQPLTEWVPSNQIPAVTSNLQDAEDYVPINPKTGKKFDYKLVTFDGRADAEIRDLRVRPTRNRATSALAVCTVAHEAQMKLRADEAGAGKE